MRDLPSYCYWGVATGRYAALMARCVTSAREAGVFNPFHVMTDQPIEGAECYDAQDLELADGLFKLIYLKAAASKLNFDYYVWVDADTVFRRKPRNLLACLGRASIHVPLEVNLSEILAGEDPGSGFPDAPRTQLSGLSIRQYFRLMAEAGVPNPIYWSRSAFWVIRREATEQVCELVRHLRALGQQNGFRMNGAACLGYAMQMLCARPRIHETTRHADLWATVENLDMQSKHSDRQALLRLNPFTQQTQPVDPCIAHVPSLVSPPEADPSVAASSLMTVC